MCWNQKEEKSTVMRYGGCLTFEVKPVRQVKVGGFDSAQYVYLAIKSRDVEIGWVIKFSFGNKRLFILAKRLNPEQLISGLKLLNGEYKKECRKPGNLDVMELQLYCALERAKVRIKVLLIDFGV